MKRQAFGLRRTANVLLSAALALGLFPVAAFAQVADAPGAPADGAAPALTPPNPLSRWRRNRPWRPPLNRLHPGKLPRKPRPQPNLQPQLPPVPRSLPAGRRRTRASG